MVVVSELYCTTSKPSGLASVHTLRVAAWAKNGLSSGANNSGRTAKRMANS
ncbi:hypothetical protein D3C84_1296730 [compost metagenome]